MKIPHRKIFILMFPLLLPLFSGCSSPEITAVNLNPKSQEPEGIPYYLPKPYLFVSKNVRYIYAPIMGPTGENSGASSNSGNAITNTTGATAKGASNTNQTGAVTTPKGTNSVSDIISALGNLAGAINTSAPNNPAATNPNTNNPAGNGIANAVGLAQILNSMVVVPPASISDEIVPQEFFTYQIVYLPDLTQKYGLRIKGGSGELKATADLVDGWMFTGLGPFDINNSTTAQNVTAAGQAIGSVVQSVGQIALSALGIPSLGGGAKNTAAELTNSVSSPIRDYAELYVFEMDFTNGIWTFVTLNNGKPIVRFNRDVIGLEQGNLSSQQQNPNPLSPPFTDINLASQAVAVITNALGTKWTFPEKKQVGGTQSGLQVQILNNAQEKSGTIVTTTIFHVAWAQGVSTNSDMKAALLDLSNDVSTATMAYVNTNLDKISNPIVQVLLQVTQIPQ
jgi:hypothetical protein